jgi:hypothetical protein
MSFNAAPCCSGLRTAHSQSLCGGVMPTLLNAAQIPYHARPTPIGRHAAVPRTRLIAVALVSFDCVHC